MCVICGRSSFLDCGHYDISVNLTHHNAIFLIALRTGGLNYCLVVSAYMTQQYHGPKAWRTVIPDVQPTSTLGQTERITYGTGLQEFGGKETKARLKPSDDAGELQTINPT